MAELFLKKDLDRLIADANDPNAGEGHKGGGALKRHLGALNLTALGIGAIIGAGIFSLTGSAAAKFAGPGIAFSFVIGAILCALAGLCYAEMAAMIPVAGSAYAYSYATMGEFVAWIIGWDLILEYAFCGVTVAVAWSGYFVSLLHTMNVTLSDAALRFTQGPWNEVVLASGAKTTGLWNVPATAISIIVGLILYRGIQESAIVNNIIVFVKVTIVVVFILLGITLIDKANIFVNPQASGLAALVPAVEKAADGSVHYGWLNGGVLTGAGVVFFAYIGFDAVSTAAQEAKNPKRDMPIGILASLVICTILYILVAVTLTGVVSYKELNTAAPIAVGIDKIVALRNWPKEAGHTFLFFIKFGALCGLTSVILVMMLGQTRIFYSMSKDGLLPWFGAVHPKHKSPYVGTIVTAIFVAIFSGLLPMSIVGELVSIGTLLAFTLVCIGVPILRRTCPNVERPFKTPLPWIVGPAGALACLYVMSGLPLDTWLRLAIWLVIGFVIYFTYGVKHSRLQNGLTASAGQRPAA